jgi:hypothetical protein
LLGWQSAPLKPSAVPSHTSTEFLAALVQLENTKTQTATVLPLANSAAQDSTRIQTAKRRAKLALLVMFRVPPDKSIATNVDPEDGITLLAIPIA